jgi:Asp-tRNA(Asn)/Glu-tRNA(Gln) amidotransferase A subunit family amidase
VVNRLVGQGLSARRIASDIAQGRLTAEAALRACLERIEAVEPDVQAWQWLDPEVALGAARALDRGPSRGVLHGVPIGVKDVFDTCDMPTAYGSALYAGNRPMHDAASVATVRSKGALVVGKTVTTEFAYSSPSKTRNPHRPTHTPGGSSSGSAAAVAAGMVPLAFGTQTAGSIIRPASFCGAVGYKPSFGLIERAGVKTFAASLDTVGVIANSVGDAAFLVAAASDRPALADVAPATGLRVGLYRSREFDRAEPATRDAMARAARIFENIGFKVRDIPVDGRIDYLDLQEALMDWEVLRALSFERLFHFDKLAAKTREQIQLLESRASLQRYDAAVQEINRARVTLPDVFGVCDVLLVPSAPGEAPLGLASTGDPVFNQVWTMLHMPCVTIPTGYGPAGMPVGVQLVGQIGDDARLLSAATELEAALGPVK